jgi:hypothetical protein
VLPVLWKQSESSNPLTKPSRRSIISIEAGQLQTSATNTLQQRIEIKMEQQYMDIRDNSIAIELEDAIEQADNQGFRVETIADFVKTPIGKMWIEGTRARGGVLPVEAMTQVDAIVAQTEVLKEIANSLATIAQSFAGRS